MSVLFEKRNNFIKNYNYKSLTVDTWLLHSSIAQYTLIPINMYNKVDVSFVSFYNTSIIIILITIIISQLDLYNY